MVFWNCCFTTTIYLKWRILTESCKELLNIRDNYLVWNALKLYAVL